MEEITLKGNKQDLIDVIEGYMAYLLAEGYDNSSPSWYHPDLNKCTNFLSQLDGASELIKEVNDHGDFLDKTSEMWIA